MGWVPSKHCRTPEAKTAVSCNAREEGTVRDVNCGLCLEAHVGQRILDCEGVEDAAVCCGRFRPVDGIGNVRLEGGDVETIPAESPF